MSVATKAAPAAACIDPGLIQRANEVGKILKHTGMTVVTAESCTAGLIAAVLSQADDAGEVLHGSFATYTKAHKAAALGVPAVLLDEKGSVSEAVAVAMAEGALTRSPADIAIAVTGVLGPKRDEDGNPVGLVYFCCATRSGKPTVLRETLGPQYPDALRHIAVTAALDLLADQAKKSP